MGITQKTDAAKRTAKRLQRWADKAENADLQPAHVEISKGSVKLTAAGGRLIVEVAVATLNAAATTSLVALNGLPVEAPNPLGKRAFTEWLDAHPAVAALRYVGAPAELSRTEWVKKYGERPQCPLCGSPCRRVTSPLGAFWGCEAYKSGCKGTIDIVSDQDPLSFHGFEACGPKCSGCGLPMRQRKARNTGETFWGCTGFPKCRRTIDGAAARGLYTRVEDWMPGTGPKASEMRTPVRVMVPDSAERTASTPPVGTGHPSDEGQQEVVPRDPLAALRDRYRRR